MMVKYIVFGKTIAPQFKSSEKLLLCNFSIPSALNVRKITIQFYEIFPVSLIDTQVLLEKFQLIMHQGFHQYSNLKLCECGSFIIPIRSEVALNIILLTRVIASHLVQKKPWHTLILKKTILIIFHLILLFASHLKAISEHFFRNPSIKRYLAIMNENYLGFSFPEHKQNTY
jgi:hypothetical protein